MLGGKTGTQFYMECELDIDFASYNKALNYVIEKQPMLRARVLNNRTFYIEENLIYSIKVTNTTIDEENYIEKRREELSHKVFSDADFPLFSIEMLHLKNGKYYMFVNIDLVIADGQSAMIFSNQIKEHYLNGTEIDQQEEILLESIEKYKRLRKSKHFTNSKNYWLAKKEKDIIKKSDIYIKENNYHEGKFVRIEKFIDKMDYKKLVDNCKVQEINSSALLLYLFNVSMSHYSTADDFYTNVTLSLRPSSLKYKSVISDYTSTMLVQHSEREKDIRSNILKIQQNMMTGLRNRYFEGVDVIRLLSEKETQTMPFVFTSMLFDEELFFDNFYDIKYWISQTSQVYLDNQVKISHGTLHVSWDYAVEVIDGELLKNMFDLYIFLIEEYCQGMLDLNKKIDRYLPQRTSSLQLGDISDKKLEIDWSNMKYSNYVIERESIDPITLMNKTNEYYDLIGNYKIEKNFSKVRIGINSNKDIDNLAMFLAVWKQNDSICCINSSPNIYDSIIEDAGCNLIMIDGSIIEHDIQDNFIDFDEAYVLFTSGTTGRPKGVSVSYEAMLNTCQNIVEKFEIDSNDVVANVSKWSFDLSVFDILSPLLCGCKTQIYEKIDDKSNFEQITIWNSTPKIYEYAMKKHNLNNVKIAFLSGDVITTTLVSESMNKLKTCKIISLGGATEAGIWSVYFPIDRSKQVQYGYPLSNQKTCIISDKDEILPNYITGELAIGGKSLAGKYINTNRDSFFLMHGERWYKTGDQCVNFEKNGLRILGRKDKEYKLNGYRIDLIEIENQILKLTPIDELNLYIKKTVESDTLCCLYVNKEGKNIDFYNLLKKNLAMHTIPKFFIEIDQFSLTDNGKKDEAFIKNKIDEYFEGRVDRALNEVEVQVANIWNKVLNQEKKYLPYQSFFEVGGNSLYAGEVIYELNNTFNINIEIHKIFEYNSLESIARLVSDTSNGKNHKNRNLVMLRKGISDKTIVLIHAGSGEVAVYLPFCDYLDIKYNIYAIKYDKSELPMHPELKDFKQLASKYNQYIEDLDNIEYIGGWCIGGTIGYEMLSQQRKTKTTLLLINSLPPNQKSDEFTSFTISEELAFLAKHNFPLFGVRKEKSVEQLWSDITVKVGKNKIMFNMLKNMVPDNLKKLIPYFNEIDDSEKLISYINLFRGFESSRFNNYRQENKIENKCIYFNAIKESASNFLSWESLLPNMIVKNIDNDHIGIIQRCGIEQISNQMEVK